MRTTDRTMSVAPWFCSISLLTKTTCIYLLQKRTALQPLMTDVTYWIGARKKNGAFTWVSTGDKVDNAVVETVMENLGNKTAQHCECLSVVILGDDADLITYPCDEEDPFVCEAPRGIPVAA